MYCICYVSRVTNVLGTSSSDTSVHSRKRYSCVYKTKWMRNEQSNHIQSSVIFIFHFQNYDWHNMKGQRQRIIILSRQSSDTLMSLLMEHFHVMLIVFYFQVIDKNIIHYVVFRFFVCFYLSTISLSSWLNINNLSNRTKELTNSVMFWSCGLCSEFEKVLPYYYEFPGDQCNHG